MSEMIERAALALRQFIDQKRAKYNEGLAREGLWADHTWMPSDRDCARAVIAAMREPTEAMLMDGHSETPYCMADPENCNAILGDRTCHEGMADAYRAMIDAALEGSAP